MTLMEALYQVQVKKSKYYNQRYIVELSVVDRKEYKQLLTRYFVDAQQAPQRLGELERKAKVASLRQIGLLLG